MELYPFPEMEGISQPILRNIPALRQRRLRNQFIVQPDKSVEDQLPHTVSACIIRQDRIICLRIYIYGNIKLVSVCLVLTVSAVVA